MAPRRFDRNHVSLLDPRHVASIRVVGGYTVYTSHSSGLALQSRQTYCTVFVWRWGMIGVII